MKKEVKPLRASFDNNRGDFYVTPNNKRDSAKKG